MSGFWSWKGSEQKQRQFSGGCFIETSVLTSVLGCLAVLTVVSKNSAEGGGNGKRNRWFLVV